MKKYLAFFITFIMAISNCFCVFASEEDTIDLFSEEIVDIEGIPVELTEFKIDGYKSIYDKETEMYTFELIEENEIKNIEEEFCIDPEDISTEVQYSDEAIIIESGMEQGNIQGIENDEVMAAANSLPDLYVYDLKATTDLIVGQEQNRFSYKVANLGGSIAQDVEVAFVVDDRVAGTYNLGDIGASQAVGGYFVLGKISQSGTHGVGVYADYRNLIEESNETNNSMGKYFTWYETSNYKPDLTVEIKSPTKSSIEGSRNSSDTREFVFKISNIGPAATSEDGFIMAVYVDNKKIGNMQIPQMNGMVEQAGRFNLGINGYLPFTLKLVVDDLDEVDESNERNNSDENRYNPYYCSSEHLSDRITLEYIPFPANSMQVQIAPNALFHCLDNKFYQLYAKKWNGITDQCKVTDIVYDTEVLNDTNIYICGGYRNNSLKEDSLGGSEHHWLPDKSGMYIKIELNEVELSKLTAEVCGRTLMHEFGHAFGMAHPPMNNDCGYPSIMQPHNSVLELISNVITAHDKYGLIKQYERRENLKEAVNIAETPKVTEEFNFYSIPGDDSIIDSEEIISDVSGYIIKGRILPESQNVVLYYDNYTLTNFEVTQVYKGDGISPGDIIQIKEPYYTETYTNGDEATYRKNNYTNSIVGEEYIFFFEKDKDGTYWPSVTSLARYPVNDEISIVFPNSDNPNYTEENYETLRNEVLSKYK